MRIPIAIYTAIEGYAWQPGTELTIAFLNEAKQEIGKFPDVSRGMLPFGGAALVGDKLVVYRYHLARNIDSFGRDALYVVLGAIPRADAARVNVRHLLDHPSFAAPCKPLPEMVIEYDGPASDPYPQGYASRSSHTVDFVESLPWLGDFAAMRKGMLRLACSPGGEAMPCVQVAYEPPSPPQRPHSRPYDGCRTKVGWKSNLGFLDNVSHWESSVEKSVFFALCAIVVVLLWILVFQISARVLRPRENDQLAVQKSVESSHAESPHGRARSLAAQTDAFKDEQK